MAALQLHKMVLVRITALVTTFLMVAALMSGCNRSFAVAGRVVNADEGSLTIADEMGNNEIHEVAPDAEVILDGRPASLEDLENGDAAKLTTEQKDGVEVVKRIEAQSKEDLGADKTRAETLLDYPGAPAGLVTTDILQQPPGVSNSTPRPSVAESLSGTIVSVGDNQFVVAADNGAEHAVMVNDQTNYTVDGNEATFDDLKVDQTVHAAVDKEGDNNIATMVDASSDSAE